MAKKSPSSAKSSPAPEAEAQKPDAPTPAKAAPAKKSGKSEPTEKAVKPPGKAKTSPAKEKSAPVEDTPPPAAKEKSPGKAGGKAEGKVSAKTSGKTAAAKSQPTPAAPEPKPGKATKAPRAAAAEFAEPSTPSAKKAPALNRADLRSSILAKSKTKEKFRPIAYTFEEAREVARVAAVAAESAATAAAVTATRHSARSGKMLDEAQLAKPAQPNRVRAASLADILGFNPKISKQPTPEDDSTIPEKFRRYYKLLIELRNHLTGQLDTHTEETLKRSSKDDAGDLSSYGQHMADAGTDTFDRDFALSVVSNEQEALTEVEAAIQRIKAGTYGVCEMTQKPIARERLVAVPFTRYSAEAQKDIERNRHRSRAQAGLFGELGDENGGMGGGGDDGGGDD